MCPRASTNRSKKPWAFGFFFCPIIELLAVSSFAEGEVVLEEVVVNARKRTELQVEVPLSMSVLSGSELQTQAVGNVELLGEHVAGLQYMETGVSTQVTVRGVGSAGNQGFEQSVGMYMDGVHYGRAVLYALPLLDIERVELLRGPQNILFGKNAIAGALNIQSVRPSAHSSLNLRYSTIDKFAQDEWQLSAGVPLSDVFRVRAAVRVFEEQGYLYNTWLGRSEEQKEESSYRIGAEWDAGERLNFYLKAEQHQLLSEGRNALMTYDQSLIGGLNYAEYLQLLSYAPFEIDLPYARTTSIAESGEDDVSSLGLISTLELEGLRLQSTTAKVTFESDELCDCDFTSAEIINLAMEESYEQFSQEIRLESVGPGLQWQAGLYYQYFEQDFSDRVSVYENNFFAGEFPLLANTGIARDFQQESESWAAFASLAWEFKPDWQVTVGARFTQENKKADKEINIVQLTDGSVIDDPRVAYIYLTTFQVESEQAILQAEPGVPSALWQALNFSGHKLEGKRDEQDLSPHLTLEWRQHSDSRYYFNWSRGFKAGGFDPRSNRAGTFSTVESTASEIDPHLHFEFEEEKVQALEVGHKRSFFDGRAELHAALFYSQFEDLQVSQFDGGSGFVVGNVASLDVRGIELEGRLQVTDRLLAKYSLALLDAKYGDYKNANCYVGQEPDGLDIDGDGDLDTCDASGEQPVRAPKITFNIGLNYNRPLWDAWHWQSAFFAQHLSSHQVNANLDPVARQGSVNLLNFRSSLHYKNYYFALLAKNILDEYYISNSDAIPLAELQFASNTQAGWVQRPRNIAVEVGLRF